MKRLRFSCSFYVDHFARQSLECLVVDGAQSPVNGHTDDSHMESDSDGGLALDDVLLKLQSGVEMALHRAQAWSKFAKDLAGYIEKRTNMCTCIAISSISSVSLIFCGREKHCFISIGQNNPKKVTVR